jgi:hypothetical protein
MNKEIAVAQACRHVLKISFSELAVGAFLTFALLSGTLKIKIIELRERMGTILSFTYFTQILEFISS